MQIHIRSQFKAKRPTHTVSDIFLESQLLNNILMENVSWKDIFMYIYIYNVHHIKPPKQQYVQ